jgi:hypothetical protein
MHTLLIRHSLTPHIIRGTTYLWLSIGGSFTSRGDTDTWLLVGLYSISGEFDSIDLYCPRTYIDPRHLKGEPRSHVDDRVTTINGRRSLNVP